MSGTSALLNLLEGSGSALLNAPETAQNGASEADSSYFVSLMKQYEGAEPQSEAGPAKDRDVASELLGNGLPTPLPIMSMSPVTPQPSMMLPAAIEVEADTRLEEFAVGLGIDRELARLLLRETSPQVSAPDVRPITALPMMPSVQVPLGDPQGMVPNQDVAPIVSAPIDRSPALISSTERSVVASVTTQLPVSLNPLPLGATTPPLIAGAPVVDGSIPLPAALDTSSSLDMRMAERSVVSQATAASPAVISSDSSAVPSLAAMVSPRAPAALNDEDVLRWRAFIHRSASGVREPAQEIVASTQSAIDDVMDPLSTAPRRGLSEADFAAATASLRGFALERRQIVTTTATAVSSTMLSGDSPVDPAVLPTTGGMPMNAAAAPSYALGSPLAAQPDPLTTPLRVPDPTLQHELRAEQFAEQVGRRMLQQIREDRWTVNLQLDPQRLGPMDIELQLEGNQVTAQVGVANAEVRNLLEAALPKLRESLDSAGLNLANWSFAQSGAREYREFAQQSAAAARKVATSSADVAIEDGNSRRVSDESASRVVDVYV